jgi:hypothetical protein
MVLCKTCEAINGELKCVVFFLLCVVNLRGGIMSTGSCTLFGLRGLCYKM